MKFIIILKLRNKEINAEKIIVVIYATYAFAKIKPEKNPSAFRSYRASPNRRLRLVETFRIKW